MKPAVIILIIASATACADAPPVEPATGVVAMTLELPPDPLGCDPKGTDCAAFCVDNAGADIYREDDLVAIPIGPGKTALCGEDIQFDELPAGHNVYLKAWIGAGGTRVFEGQSPPITVKASDVTTAEILMAPVAPPQIASVSPDPLVLGQDTLSITGAGFGGGQGLSEINIDCAAFPVPEGDWGDAEITIKLPSSAKGANLRVRRCGVPSAIKPVRLVPATPATAPLTPPGCSGWTARDIARAPDDDVMIAAACADGSGTLLRLDPNGCGYGDTVTLSSAPVAIAALTTETLVATADGGVLSVSMDNKASATSWPMANGAVRAMAAVADTAYAITDTTLYALDSAGSSALPNVSPLALQDVAVADGVVLIAAQSTGVGSGKLVVYDVDSTNSDDKSFAGCTTPVGVAARPGTSWVALACAEPAGLGVVGYDLAANQWGAWADLGSGAFAGVALDAVGDVALVLDSSAGGTLSATVLEDGRALAAWDLLDGVSGNVGSATVDDAHTLMVGWPAGSVTAVGPYATGAPCSGVAP